MGRQKLAPAYYLLMCSDGIVEAGTEDAELLGFERAASCIREGCSQGRTPGELIDHVLANVSRYPGETAQCDDQTIVVMQVEAWMADLPIQVQTSGDSIRIELSGYLSCEAAGDG